MEMRCPWPATARWIAPGWRSGGVDCGRARRCALAPFHAARATAAPREPPCVRVRCRSRTRSSVPCAAWQDSPRGQPAAPRASSSSVDAVQRCALTFCGVRAGKGPKGEICERAPWSRSGPHERSTKGAGLHAHVAAYGRRWLLGTRRYLPAISTLVKVEIAGRSCRCCGVGPAGADAHGNKAAALCRQKVQPQRAVGVTGRAKLLLGVVWVWHGRRLDLRLPSNLPDRRQLSASLAVLLVDPTLDPVCRQAQAVQGSPRLAVAQAGLPAKAGGLSLLPASSLWAVARLAGAMAVRPYLIEHADSF
eukprot:scaffold28698_cov47-Phaeocystis_antarctica.AAC.1